jgi:hypothetical protein
MNKPVRQSPERPMGENPRSGLWGRGSNHQNAFRAKPPRQRPRGGAETTSTPCSRSPHTGSQGVAPQRYNPGAETTETPCGRSPHRGVWGQGGWGAGAPHAGSPSPQKIHKWGRDQRSLTMVRGCPSPGGRARGTARSRPWGGRPDPSLKKHIPNAPQHEAAQVNYNINELIVNRCSAGLFTASGHLSGCRRSPGGTPRGARVRAPQVTRVRPAGPRRGRPSPESGAAARKGCGRF